MMNKEQLEQFLNQLYWMVEHGKIKEGVEALNNLQNNAAVFADIIPGSWSCDKCGFTLQKSILNASTGGISANIEPFNEHCPNDGTLMKPTTYKGAYSDMVKVCHQQINRACEAEEKHDKITEMVSRFLVPHRTSIADCWKDAFVECGAVTIDKTYPYGLVAPVKIQKS